MEPRFERPSLLFVASFLVFAMGAFVFNTANAWSLSSILGGGSNGNPAYGNPAYGNPAYGNPAYGQPQGAYGGNTANAPYPYGNLPPTDQMAQANYNSDAQMAQVGQNQAAVSIPGQRYQWQNPQTGTHGSEWAIGNPFPGGGAGLMCRNVQEHIVTSQGAQINNHGTLCYPMNQFHQ